MKRLLLVMCAIFLFAGIAEGVTDVYDRLVRTIGTKTSFINGVAAAGDTTAITVAAGDRLELKRIDFQPDITLTGTVNIQLGVANVYSIYNAQANNVYGKNLNSDYNAGENGADLVINAPGVVRYNIDYRLN